jgi:hypothetical protein
VDDNPEKSRPELAPKRTKKGQFAKGSSGNVAGKPPGTRTKRTRALEEILDQHSQEILEKGIAVALGGDTTMLRTLIGLLIPARRRPVKFEIPVINNAQDALLASRLIVAGTAAGEITPDEAAQLGKVLELHARLVEVHDLEGRLVELERERGLAPGTAVQ